MKNHRAYGSLLAIALALLLFSCDKDEEVPAFIKVSSVDVQTDLASEGSDSHNITDTWAYVDDQLLGVFGIPAEMPALYEGTHNVKLIAGIKKNGIASTRIQYPFYKTYETDLDLHRELDVHVDPVFEYFDNVNFWIEDFEGVGHSFVIGSQSDTTLLTITDPNEVIEGNATGGVVLDDAHTLFRCHTNENFAITAGQPVFLEMDYRSNNRMLIGASFDASGTAIEVPVLFVNPSEERNKIYVDLTAAFSPLGTSNREIYIEVLKANDVDTARVFFDNIKLVRTGP